MCDYSLRCFEQFNRLVRCVICVILTAAAFENAERRRKATTMLREECWLDLRDVKWQGEVENFKTAFHFS
jgi:hypothetical protein